MTEDLDRLSRDQEDIAGIYKRMEFADVKIATLSDGRVRLSLHVCNTSEQVDHVVSVLSG